MKYAINLFPSRRSFFTVMSNFMVYYLRYALIITLFIVVIVFFLRMQIDQKLIDEQSKMSQKKAIVKATEGIRADLQTIQKKVKDINLILADQDSIVEIINYVTKTIPTGVEVKSIDISSSQISLSGTTSDYRKIQSLQKRLQKEARFEKTDVSGIVRDKGGVYSFAVMLANWKGLPDEKIQ